MTEIEKAIQEFEDNAYHNSLHPEISEKSKAVALAALRAQEEAEKNEPLTPEELLEMDGEPVFLPKAQCWVLITNNPLTPLFTFPDGGQCSAKDWYEQVGPVYRHKPKEA